MSLSLTAGMDHGLTSNIIKQDNKISTFLIVKQKQRCVCAPILLPYPTALTRRNLTIPFLLRVLLGSQVMVFLAPGSQRLRFHMDPAAVLTSESVNFKIILINAASKFLKYITSTTRLRGQRARATSYIIYVLFVGAGHMCGGQRTRDGNWFSPTIQGQVFRSGDSHLNPLSQGYHCCNETPCPKALWGKK